MRHRIVSFSAAPVSFQVVFSRVLLFLIIFSSFIPGRSAAWEASPDSAFTADGVKLGLKRYANPGTQPVVLVHGTAQDLDSWDIPGFPDQALALYLADRGYDVWSANMRGRGDPPYRSTMVSDHDWSIDDFAVHDVPAIVDRVIEVTGRKPFYVTFSLGGMALNAYLQGAEYQWVVVDYDYDWVWDGWWWKKVETPVYDWRIGSSLDLSRERNGERLEGAVVISTPPKMKWKHDVNIFTFWLYSYWDYNLLLDEFSHSWASLFTLYFMDYLPSGTLSDFLLDSLEDIPFIGDILAVFIEWLIGHGADSFATAQVWNPLNMTPELCLGVLDHTLENISDEVLWQFVDGIRDHTFRERRHNDAARDPYTYSDHYDLITLPYLCLAGSMDKMACDDVIENGLYGKVSSEDRTFESLFGFGHVDMISGVRAGEEVFPRIEQWIDERCEP